MAVSKLGMVEGSSGRRSGRALEDRVEKWVSPVAGRRGREGGPIVENLGLTYYT